MGGQERKRGLGRGPRRVRDSVSFFFLWLCRYESLELRHRELTSSEAKTKHFADAFLSTVKGVVG